MTHRWRKVSPDYRLVSIESALAAIRLDVTFKPLVKVLGYCQAASWSSNALFETNQQFIHAALGVTLAPSHSLEVTLRAPIWPVARVYLDLP
jgi:uncharacterized MAPEG superfamily protein